MNYVKRGPERLSERGLTLAWVLWLCSLVIIANAFACGDYGCGKWSLFFAAFMGGSNAIPAYFITRVLAAFYPRLVTTERPRNWEGIGND